MKKDGQSTVIHLLELSKSLSQHYVALLVINKDILLIHGVPFLCDPLLLTFEPSPFLEVFVEGALRVSFMQVCNFFLMSPTCTFYHLVT